MSKDSHFTGQQYKVNDYPPFSSQTIRTTIASLGRSGGQGKTWGPMLDML